MDGRQDGSDLAKAAQRVAAKVASPEGREILRQGAARARERAEELIERTRVTPELMSKRVTL